MAFQEREVCCCGARTWTLVIGWIETIGSILSIFLIGFFSVVLSASAIESSQYGYISDGQRETFTTVIIVVAIITGILSALNFYMNVGLLRGTYNKNPHQINAWLIYTSVISIIYAVTMFALLFIVPLEKVPMVVIFTCVMVAVDGFFIWVVGIHKAEIEASTGVTITYKV